MAVAAAHRQAERHLNRVHRQWYRTAWGNEGRRSVGAHSQRRQTSVLNEFIGGIANCQMASCECSIFSKRGCTPLCLLGLAYVYEHYRCGIDILPTGTHALVSQQVGRAHLVAISQDENCGKVKQVYTVEPDLQADAVYDANALFVGPNDAVLYGSANGYLFARDKANAKVLCGLDHGQGT
jgi:hypothetical protein